MGNTKLRQILKEHQASVPDQKGKPTEQLTLQWIFSILDTVSFVRFQVEGTRQFKEIVFNIKGPPREIIDYFGK